MADKLLQQGRDTAWLCDDQTGAALVKQVGASGVENSELITNYDAVGTTLAYVGKAPAGTLASAAGWQVKELVFNAAGDVTTTMADGDAAFDNIWNDRATLTYS